jgi:6-phosphogluconolactonase
VTIWLGGYGPAVLTARATPRGLVVVSTVDCPGNPTWLAPGPDRRVLYASHELDDGLLSAFAVGPGGALRLIGSVRSGGALPIHLSVHPGGRFVLTAHWGSGELAVHRVAGDGSLGEAAHVLPTGKAAAHMIGCDPSGRWVLAVHLGLGTVTTYRLDPGTGRLAEHAVLTLPPTCGPRHLAFDPTDAARAYVVNELHSTLTALAFDAGAGRFAAEGTVSTLPPGTDLENYPSGVLVSADGRFVYVANRFHDSVAVFAAGPAPRLLTTYPCGGAFPRDLALTPDGARLYVANERSDAVTGFAVDRAGGGLRPVGPPLAMPGPARVLPADG